ncbi:MAG TPA: hypothetical protein VNI54_00270 [Thermoanaerobaculia bacterium]|nr:hypothetical protein [Thermoanaerobaculia bacterium]
MKRIAVAFGLVLFAAAASANEAFILNIPLRFNASQETGEVRITLALAGAPAGSQLVVGGSTLNLGATQTVAGDSVAFTAGADPNTVRIVYQPLSNFAGTFCAGAGAVEKNINMRFVGPDITKYNINSYLVASPGAECSKASKRTNDSPAVLVPNDDGVAPALDAEFGGRHPLDVVIVLDKSGSMTELPPGADTGATKAEILRSAMKTFVATWSEMDFTFVNDRIGIVFFSGTALNQSQPGGDPPSAFFLRRGVYAEGAEHDWFPLRANIDTLAPGGSTSVGAGINSGMQAWAADPDHDLSMLVVTDGKQNTAPQITVSGGFLTLTPVASFPAELRQRFVPIQSIGFGTPGAVDGELLTKLALETSGVSYISVNATDMFDTLAMTLVSILKGNTAALALRHNDVLTTKIPDAQPVLIDRSVKRAVFSVQWAPPLANALDLEVFRPDGSLAKPDSGTKTPQSSLQSFDIDKANDIGTWRVRVKRAKTLTSAAVARRVPYTLHTYFVEDDLDFHITIDPKQPSTGDVITVRAQVSYAGKPLANLPDGSITVRVQRPSEGLGTILHNLRGQEGGATTIGGDAVSPLDLKVSRLPRGVLKRVIPADVETLTLRHEANGIYTATFDGTSVPGQYGFETVLQWDHRRTGALRREERLETTVRVRPDPFMSEIVVSPNVRGVVTVSVTPRDRFGNFLGPGYTSRISAKLASAGRLDPRPADRSLTGTYVFTIREVPAGETPRLEILVDDVPLRKK